MGTHIMFSGTIGRNGGLFMAISNASLMMITLEYLSCNARVFPFWFSCMSILAVLWLLTLLRLYPCQMLLSLSL